MKSRTNVCLFLFLASEDLNQTNLTEKLNVNDLPTMLSPRPPAAGFSSCTVIISNASKTKEIFQDFKILGKKFLKSSQLLSILHRRTSTAGLFSTGLHTHFLTNS